MSGGITRFPILLRVLVADGGSSVNDALTAMLSEFEGFSVFGCAQNSSKVLALVRTVRPDVVILDLKMAGPVGLKTLKQIKRLPHCPVVLVLSDYDMPSVRQAVMAAGADHYLVKTECGLLREALRALLRDRRRHQAVRTGDGGGGNVCLCRPRSSGRRRARTGRHTGEARNRVRRQERRSASPQGSRRDTT